VGTVSAVATEDGFCIRSVAVLPSERGNGSGKKLLDVVTTYSVENRWQTLLLSKTPFLYSAIALCEHCGFVRSEEQLKKPVRHTAVSPCTKPLAKNKRRTTPPALLGVSDR
jgi:N-acetylglutamate synthase-like GNAT family acetyltransferase